MVIPRTCDYVTLCGKKDFTHVTKFRISRWGNQPGLSSWTQCDHKVPSKREARGSELEKVM